MKTLLLRFFLLLCCYPSFAQPAATEPARKPVLNILLRDEAKYNSTNAQKEFVFKVNYETDGSEKLLRSTLDALLHGMTELNWAAPEADPEPEDEYYYTWWYTNSEGGIIISGYAQCYPNADIQRTGLEPFKSWFIAVCDDWANDNGLTDKNIKYDKRGDYFVKISFELP